MSATKPDYRLALGYGSAWHLMRCLGWHRELFSERISQAAGLTNIRWLDFPLERTGLYYPTAAPVLDREWTRLEFAGEELLQARYAEFWPRAGSQQNWDAIGIGQSPAGAEWILVEANATMQEVDGSGTSANEHGGRPKIRRSYVETLSALGHQPAAAAKFAEIWLNTYYQHANRLAALHFFLRNGVRAQLVFLYFCGDVGPSGAHGPTSAAGWAECVDRVKTTLQLSGNSDLESRVHDVFINVETLSPA
ncbi:MAG: hypothetical protein JSR82_05905 [Verrucomicrobia bacterium]|nr:hypothetical protein [Verrucomicrobiota bacterium]